MTSDEQSTPLQPQPGASGNMKLLIWLGVGGVVLIFVCGIGGIFLFQKIVAGSRKMAADTRVRNPIRVREMTAEIVDIEIPDEWIAGFGSRMMMISVGVDYQNDDGIPVLRLIQLNQAVMANQPPQQVENFLSRSAQQLDAMYSGRGGGLTEKLKNINSESREIEMNGQTVTFEFATGEMGKKKTMFRRVTGDFEGKRGPANIIIQLPEDEFDDEMVESVLKSIGT